MGMTGEHHDEYAEAGRTASDRGWHDREQGIEVIRRHGACRCGGQVEDGAIAGTDVERVRRMFPDKTGATTSWSYGVAPARPKRRRSR